MLSNVTRRQARPAARVSVVLRRTLTTETVSTPGAQAPPPPPPTKHPTRSNNSRINPRPRRTSSSYDQLYPRLPPSFGRNQLLNVSNSTRALLESIVAEFNAPIRYAFAYGSGVFEQDGYNLSSKGAEAPMLDFMFAVSHPSHFHSINMQQFPGHYPLHARVFGSDFVSRVGDIKPGVWFNAYVPMKGVNIKYGVTHVDNLCSDLLGWQTLYLAGRMHKPVRIIKDDARVRLTQQVNLTSALRAALLTLPEEFSQTQLFERIASISYGGDPRMLLPAENRGKVGNIVRKQRPQFEELYYRLMTGLPGVHWPAGTQVLQQDTSPQARSAHLKKLPSNLLTRVQGAFAPSAPSKEADESAYWAHIAGDERLPSVLDSEMSNIVRYPATIQTLKGIVSSGVGKSVKYSSRKIGKWWRGSGSSSSGKDTS